MNARPPASELDALIDGLGFSLPASAFEPERLMYAVRFDRLGLGPAPWRLARAQRELARLHLRELARLLRRAIAVRERASSGSRTSPATANGLERDLAGLPAGARASLCAESADAPLSAEAPVSAASHNGAPRPERRSARWRRELENALSLASADGARVSPRLLEMLSSLLGTFPGSSSRGAPDPWPAASELARAALALHDCAAGRVALGEAWLREGRRQDAAAQLVEALRRSPAQAIAARALAGLERARSRRSSRPASECA